MSRLIRTFLTGIAAMSIVSATLVTIVSSASATEASATTNDAVASAWSLYKAKFVTAEGRVTDDDNGMISHSEGQGYGMLVAVAADDRREFEKIWNWTNRELFVRSDRLAAWRWDPAADPHTTDMNDATDGDLLIAWALLRAGRRWDVEAWVREARGIVDDVVDLAVVDSPYGRVLLPAAVGFDLPSQPDGPVLNLSYWIFPAIAELETVSPRLADAKLASSGLKLIEAARFGPDRLPTDWIGFGDDGIAPARNFPPQYGYNAVRIPLYLGWYSGEHAALLAPLADAWMQAGSVVPRVVDVPSGGTVNEMVGPGYMAIADVMACAAGRTAGADAPPAFEPTTYYPSTLHILSLMALSERYPRCR